MSERARRQFNERTRWTADELNARILESADLFRASRLQEPLEAYLDEFDEFKLVITDILKETSDLRLLDEYGLSLLTDPKKLIGFRYLAGPPISKDDLTTLAESTFNPTRLRDEPKLVNRLIQIIRDVLDQRRFPWISELRDPTPIERECAIVSSAALIATQNVATARRNDSKLQQEELVATSLLELGLAVSDIRSIPTLHDAPRPGTFCGKETMLGDRKADLIVRLWDGRIMPIECKVSNSAINSVKRVNNDAAAKAETWIRDFGLKQVVPVAVLSGIFSLNNLLSAQERGLTLYWAHRLDEMVAWIDGTGMLA